MNAKAQTATQQYAEAMRHGQWDRAWNIARAEMLRAWDLVMTLPDPDERRNAYSAISDWERRQTTAEARRMSCAK